MAYRIVYGEPIPKPVQVHSSPLRIQILTAGCLLTFLMLVKIWFPAGTRKLQEYLLPAQPSVTQQALDNLVMSVRCGNDFKDAFTVFCQEIITHDETLSG